MIQHINKRIRKMNLYYKIWVDGIVKLRSLPANKGMWKFYAITFITMAMAVNLLLIMTILQKNIFKYSFYELPITFSESKLSSLFNFFILYFLPPLLINYFLIFRNNRYEELIGKYKSYNGKLCVSYLMVSYFLPFVLIIVAALIGIA
jgi:hypothetical protein